MKWKVSRRRITKSWLGTPLVVAMLISLFVFFASPAPVLAGSATWYVDDSGSVNFTTIQEAVNAAPARDTIIVKDGTYSDDYPLMSPSASYELVPFVVPLVADFTADVTLGNWPLTVNFTDQSTGSPTSWEWDFDNDGTVDSTDQNPSYTFTLRGPHTVTLNVTNMIGSDDEVKADYIMVIAPLWGPYLTGTTTSGTTINIKTESATAATVEYATEACYLANSTYDMSATDSTSTELHHIELTGLEAGTTYHYRVIYGTETTEDLIFNTFPTSGPFTFIVYGDSQDQVPLFSQAERHKLVADAIAGETGISFVLHTGDLVNQGNLTEDWDRFFDAARSMLSGAAIYPALGNHENYSALYFNAFNVDPYYSFVCANAYFAVLDSNGGYSVTEQSTWLESDLPGDKPWKFVSFHHPMYTSEEDHWGGWAEVFGEWRDVFLSGGVSAVWNGHIHAYERYLNNGIMYTMIGTGGGPSYPLSETKYDGYQNSLEHSLAYARVNIDPAADTATVEIIRVADVSVDNTEVTMVYPPGTILETYVLTHPSITASTSEHGSIDPVGEVAVGYGNDQTFTITPNAGYAVADVLVDGSPVGSVTSYTFHNVIEDHTITASFIESVHSWDLNGDHVCNIGDVVVVGLHWDETGATGWIPEDLNNDGVINIGDVVVLGLHWGDTW
jgi:PKD repeat protein